MAARTKKPTPSIELATAREVDQTVKEGTCHAFGETRRVLNSRTATGAARVAEHLAAAGHRVWYVRRICLNGILLDEPRPLVDTRRPRW